MKPKILPVLILALILALTLAACRNNAQQPSGGSTAHVGDNPPLVNQPIDPTQPPTEEPDITPISAQIGEIIRFGEHDWRVLDVQDNHALIITEIAFERRLYNNTAEDITWEASSIRQYLNGTFLDSFGVADQARIREIELVNSDNPWSSVAGGADTTDMIFLLSIDEVLRYFGDINQLPDRANEATWAVNDQYNDLRRALNEGNHIQPWWLRSPGANSRQAARIDRDGGIDLAGNTVGADGGVRPALWLRLR